MLHRSGFAFVGLVALLSGIGCGEPDEAPKKSRAEQLCDTFCLEVAKASGLDCYVPDSCSSECEWYFGVDKCPDEFAALTSCASAVPETIAYCSTAEQVDVNGCGPETVALYLCMDPTFCDDPALCCSVDSTRPGCT
jgi:hypothetical protein